MFKKFFGAILGTKKEAEILATTETMTATTSTTETVASIDTTTTEAVAEELAKVEAMTTTEAVAKLAEQLAERKSTILGRCTTSEKIKKL